jgi:hypothetical protein
MMLYGIGLIGFFTSVFARLYTGRDVIYARITVLFLAVGVFTVVVNFISTYGKSVGAGFWSGILIYLGFPFLCGWLAGWPIGVIAQRLLDRTDRSRTPH